MDDHRKNLANENKPMGLDKTLHHIRLVGGFNPSEKYESQLGLFFPIYGKIKVMFQTTNQYWLIAG